MHVEKCPVCEGRGHVPQGFYLDLCSTTGTCGPVMCRACQGKGYMFVSDEIKFDTISNPSFTITTGGTGVGNSFTVKSGELIPNQ
jgi:DnaJ-class molecular chaperone